MAQSEDVIAVFKADIEQFKAQLTELGVKIGAVDKKVEDTNKKTKKGFEDTAKSAKKLGTDVADGLGNKFSQLGARIAAAFAIERIIAFGKACVTSFREAEKSANQLKFAVTAISNEGVKAFEKLIAQAKELQSISIFSDESIQNSQTQLIQLGLTSDQVEKLIPKIIDLASAQGIDLAQATDKVIQGINGQTRGLKDAGIAFEDTGSKTNNLAILSEKLSKFQGATAVALQTSAGAAKNLENQVDDLQEAIGERLSPVLQGLQLELFDVIAGLIGAETSGDKLINSLTSHEGQVKSFTETYKNLTDAQLDAQEKFAKSDILAEGAKQEKASTQIQRDEIRKRILYIGDELKAIQNLRAERKKANEDQQKVRDDLTVKGQNDLAQASAKAKQLQDAENKKALEDLREFQKDRNEANVEAAEERLKLIREQGEVAREELEKQQADELIMIREQGEAAREELEKAEEKRLKDEKARNEERVDDAKKTLDVISKAYDEAFNRRKEQLDQEIDINEKKVEDQRRLAEKGLANTLDIRERELADSRRQQQVEAERNKRVKLLETFLNSLADFSKTDAKTALPKALLQLALATAVSAQFAEDGGVVGEIKEKSFLGRRHRGGGDMLVHAQTGEGILPRDSMNVLGRRNFELLRNVGRHPIREDIFKMPKVEVAGGATVSNQDVVKELKALQHIVKNKKETHYSVDEFGNYINRTIEDGITNITKGKLKKPKWRS